MFLLILVFSCVFTLVICMIFFFMSYKLYLDFESISVYECGFEINSKARLIFSYRFFLVAVLFLIFDVEVVLMLPAPLMCSGLFFLLFLFILVSGLIYEFYYGSLEWL